MDYVVINPLIGMDLRHEHTPSGWVTKAYPLEVYGLVSSHSLLYYLRLKGLIK